MTDAEPNLVIPHGENECQVLLACGHLSAPISNRSSTFDFPMDEHPCPICADNRYLDVRLQVELLQRHGE